MGQHQTPSSPKVPNAHMGEPSGGLRMPHGSRGLIELSRVQIAERYKKFTETLIKVAECHMKGLNGSSEENRSIIRKIWDQKDLENHCGNKTDAIIKQLMPNVLNIRSPHVFTLNMEFLGESVPNIGEFNHSRALLASKGGIIVVDPWYGKVTFYCADPKSGIVQIDNTVSTLGFHRYRVDPDTGKITVLTKGTGRDTVDIEYNLSSPKLDYKLAPEKPSNRSKGKG